MELAPPHPSLANSIYLPHRERKTKSEEKEGAILTVLDLGVWGGGGGLANSNSKKSLSPLFIVAEDS